MPIPEFTSTRGYLILSWSAVVLTLVFAYFDAQNEAGFKLKLREGPPALVALQDLRREVDISDIGEVQVVAQVDTNMAIHAVWRETWRQMRAVAYPLLAVDRPGAPLSDPPRVLGYVYFKAPLRGAELVDPARFVTASERQGAFGPIVALSGRAHAPAPLQRQVAALFEDLGRPLTGPALAVEPFFGDRTRALAPVGPSPFRIAFLAMATLFLLVAALKLRRGGPGRLARLRARRRIAPAGHHAAPASAKGRRCLAPLAPQPDLVEPADGYDAPGWPGRLWSVMERLRVASRS